MSGQPESDTPPHAQNASDAESNASNGDANTAAPDAAAPGVGEPISEDQLIAELETERLRQSEEIKTLKDRVLRAHADMENLRKRSEKERADSAKYAITKFSLDVVTIADNLQRAMDAAGAPDAMSDDVKGLYDGVKLTAQDLEKSLDKNGVKRIEALGAMFDPHLHQAIMEKPEPEIVSGTIMQVFQEGYVIGDRVLRPSMVVVARGGPKPQKEATDGAAEAQRGPTGASAEEPAPITPDDDPNT
ncbi:MAG: nucleotide exchange factor GrpE [Pseudomonadota bacterium]